MRIGAYKYVECSALHDTGVREVFENAVKAIYHKKERLLLFPTKSLRCCTIC